MGLTAGLHAIDQTKILPLMGIEPWPSRLQSVAIPTQLTRQLIVYHINNYVVFREEIYPRSKLIIPA
jgi:hypothetical protein